MNVLDENIIHSHSALTSNAWARSYAFTWTTSIALSMGEVKRA